MREFVVNGDADVVILLCPNIGVSIGELGNVVGHVACLMNGAYVWDARKGDEQIECAPIFIENGCEYGPVAC